MRYTDNIQANEIFSYEVDIRNSRLILHTQSADSKHVDICFIGALAHDFNNVSPAKNIIQDIETVEFPQLQTLCRDKIPGWLEHGFPVLALNEIELENKIKKARLKIYSVNASEGLSGIVFAKDMEIQA